MQRQVKFKQPLAGGRQPFEKLLHKK